MPFANKSLADGQLGLTEANLYPASSETIIGMFLTLTNTHTSAVVVNLYLKPSGGTSRQLGQKDLSLDPGQPYIVREIEGHVLENGDAIRGKADTDAKVDWILSGVSKT